MKDCGVSCIQMLLKYYGGYVNKNILLDMTKTNKDGTTAYHIKNTLINLGFDAKGVRCNTNDLLKEQIILPCIANVIINNSYKHFVIIYEIKKDYVIIGDPADKIKKIPIKEFNKIFNQVIIICFPQKSLPMSKEIKLNKFLIQTLKPHKKTLINIFVLSIFITLFSIFTSFYTEYVIKGINFYSQKYLLTVFIIFFSIYILKIFSDYFRNKLLSYINQKLDLELTLDVYNKIIKLPYCYYKNRTTGDVISRINDLGSVRETTSKVFLTCFVDLPLTIISLIALFIINRLLFFIGMVILFLYFISIVLFRGLFNDYIKKIQNKKSEATSYMVESIGAYETVKGMHIENRIIDKFEYKYVKLLKDVFKYENLYFLQNLFKNIINDIGFILITFIGGVLVIQNKLDFGTLFTFTSLLIYFLEPIKNIINLDSAIKEAIQSLRRVVEMVNYNNKKDGYIDKSIKGNIRFKNLDFTFNDRDYVLKNVNLNIKSGDKVMIVGKSGSGKSTLFKLIMKYYDIPCNKIYIDSIDINNYKKDVLDNSILYISQSEILFNDTLYNNIVFSSDSSKLIDIGNICYLNEILDSNLGYNMLIEENGANLSGGERQRISIARALLKPFKILVIDEGLSQVDVDLERKILKNIFKKFHDKTIIVISHRLDNLDLFDSLIRINKGKAIEVNKNE